MLDFLGSLFFLAEDGLVEGILLIQSEDGDSFASTPLDDAFRLDILVSLFSLDDFLSTGDSLLLDVCFDVLEVGFSSGELFLDETFGLLEALDDDFLVEVFSIFASVFSNSVLF